MKVNVNFIPKVNSRVILTNKTIAPKNTKSNMPLVAVPLIGYYIGENRNSALKRLLEAMQKNEVVIPQKLTPDPTDKVGLDFKSRGACRDAINEAAKNGKIDESTKKDLLNKVSFTGSPEISAEDIDLDSEYMMNPELETIYHAPPIETPEGLVKTIFGELPPDVDIDMDMWSSLRSMAKSVFGGWLE